MNKKTIAWNKSDDGYVDSKCGMFSIAPLYMGCETPQAFSATFNSPLYFKGSHGQRRCITIEGMTDSQKLAKAECERWLNQQLP